VPDTLITNDPAAARRFSAEGRTVTKMLGANHIAEEGVRKLTFTRLIGDEDLADLRGGEVTLHQFQRWAPKSHEMRVIAIGNRLFGFEIHASTSAAHIDFRADYGSLRYEPCDVPPEQVAGIRRFLAAMGLVYGALDFVVGPAGCFFLECNSGGQYGWLEAATGVPLTAALADLLTQGATT
jgi:glutathione synthase/RimK-type ligase-like ATP-grasp enzyme